MPHEQQNITSWVTKNILSSVSKLDLKQAFVKAQKVIFAEYITEDNIEKIQSLLIAINACGNKQLTRLECEVLADVCLKQKKFLAANTGVHKALAEILEKQRDTIKDENLKESVEGKITEVQQIIDANADITFFSDISNVATASTPILRSDRRPDSKKLENKQELYSYIQDLLDIRISKDVLVDIILVGNGSRENEVIILGRPGMLGAGGKQMRHVTHFAAVTHNIKESITSKHQQEQRQYFKKMIKIVRPLIDVEKNDGICLNSKQYTQFLKTKEISDDLVSKIQKKTGGDKEHTFFLIQNSEVVEDFKILFPDLLNEVQTRFQVEFKKHVISELNSLDAMLRNCPLDSVTIACEGLARLILTMFNQGKYVAFPKEGNSLLEEIRLYKKEMVNDKNILKKSPADQIRDKDFEILNYVQIIDKLHSNNGIKQYNKLLRIIDNEGPTITKAMKALETLDKIINSELANHAKKVKEYIESYSVEDVGFPLAKILHGDIDNMNQEQQELFRPYTQEIAAENLVYNIFHHAAKLLYIMFDFKPLEPELLIPKQIKDNADTVAIYPTAKDSGTCDYAIYDGVEYRQLQVRPAQAKSKKLLFRKDISEDMSPEERTSNIQEISTILHDVCVKHIKLLLMSFDGLIRGFNDDRVSKEGIINISKYFLNLVQEDYNSVMEISLEEQWIQNTEHDCNISLDASLMGATLQ